MRYHPSGPVNGTVKDLLRAARRKEIDRAKRAAARRLRQANWRQRHPVLAAWHTHLWNAKQRGIPVRWDLFEFGLFCAWTGYHLLRGDGWEIDRIKHTLPYSLDNCQLLTKLDNATKGGFERWQSIPQ